MPPKALRVAPPSPDSYGRRQSAKSEQGKSEQGKSEQGKSEQGKSEQGKSGQGKSGQGRNKRGGKHAQRMRVCRRDFGLNDDLQCGICGGTEAGRHFPDLSPR